MILLLSIPTGLLVGAALGGRIGALEHLPFRWAPLAVIGLFIQVALFTPLGNSVTGGLEPVVYVASTGAVLAAVLRNLRLAGMPIVAVGAVSNLAAVVANGGAMPADPGALALAGFAGPGANTNSVVVKNPALQPLTDVFAIPAGVPLANVFSIGDVLIGLGIVVVIAAAMRRPARSPGAQEDATPLAAPATGSRPGT